MAARRRAPPPDYEEEWHFDKRIPLALIFAVAIQFAAFVAAWTQMQSDITSTKRFLATLQTTIESRDEKINKNLERLIAVERDMKYVVEGFGRVQDTLNGLLKYDYERQIKAQNRGQATR